MNDIKQLIDNLRSDKLCEYLLRNGWTELPSLLDGQVRQFLMPTEEDAVLIPQSNEFSDYYRILSKTLSILALYEDSSLKGLFNKLSNPSSDILKWRIANGGTLSGAISFNAMGNNIEYIKEMLSSTCLDILSPTSYHKKVSVKEVQDQVAKYRLGQTEIGSYILNLICPLGYYQYNLFQVGSEDLPLGRQINVRMLANINTIQNSVLENSSQLEDNVAEGKISVNFLNALSDIYEENRDSEFSITAKWNTYVPLFGDNIISDIILQPICIEKVNEIAEAYTPKQEQNVEKTFYGKIINISGEAEVDERHSVLVTIAAIGEEGNRINVKVELNYSQYFSVVDAAFQSGANVKVTGIMTSTTKTTKLSGATIERLD